MQTISNKACTRLEHENRNLNEKIESDFKVQQLNEEINDLKQYKADYSELKGMMSIIYINHRYLDKESKLKKELETFKELNTDLEQSLKEANKVSKSDKKQIQLLETKIENLEKDLEGSEDKYRKFNKKHNEKIEAEQNYHSNTKSELRYLFYDFWDSN